MMTAVDLSCQDIEALQAMRAEYTRLCLMFPTIKRALLARNAGARAFGIDIDILTSGSRKAPVLEPRMKIMAAIKILVPTASTQTIGACFSDRDHTSVINAVNRYRYAVTQAMQSEMAA
jgi:chromosomal replication initiation ATPase DnaA